jgi:transposase
MDIKTIGVDLAKDVFEVAISTELGRVTARRRLTRRQFALFVETLEPGTRVVLEACGTAHYWARRCLARGAEVRLLPAQHVRPYVRRNKTDQADAAALLEADRCAAIHAVPIKTIEHQSFQALHRIRQQWQTTRTGRINVLRALLREQGVFIPGGAVTGMQRVAALLDDPDAAIPPLLRAPIRALVAEVRQLEGHLQAVDRQLETLRRTHPVAARLAQVPGVGPLTATALVGSVPHIGAFHSGRHFASWLGLTPRERSSGHRRHVGCISKRGDIYLRTLLIHGGRAVLRAADVRARRDATALTPFQRWALQTAARRGHNRTAVAIANKLARFIWAVWLREQDFVARPTAA